jgi:hypothetical protein
VFEYSTMATLPAYGLGDQMGKVAPLNPNNVPSGGTFVYVPGFPPCEDEQPAVVSTGTGSS